MGTVDSVTKDYITQNDKFADVCNYYLYNGEQVIKESDLSEKDITELSVFLGEDSNVLSIQKLRDVLKSCVIKTTDKAAYMIIGIENQSEIHYAMVIRNMVYDALNYSAQVQNLANEHRKNKDLRGAEFLSGMSKEDKLIPVITITIYWNSGAWDGPRSLYEMFDIEDERILEYVSDYKLNLIVPDEIEDFDKFKTEFGRIMSFIRSSNNKEEFEKNYMHPGVAKLSNNAISVLNACVSAGLKKSEKECEVDVCTAIKELVEEGRTEGIAEGRAEGRAEGIAEGEAKVLLLVQKLSEDGRTSEIAQITTDENLRAILMKEYSI